MKKILRMLFRKQSPTYGWSIFEQQSWLDKKVTEALWKKNFNLD